MLDGGGCLEGHEGHDGWGSDRGTKPRVVSQAQMMSRREKKGGQGQGVAYVGGYALALPYEKVTREFGGSCEADISWLSSSCHACLFSSRALFCPIVLACPVLHLACYPSLSRVHAFLLSEPSSCEVAFMHEFGAWQSTTKLQRTWRLTCHQPVGEPTRPKKGKGGHPCLMTLEHRNVHRHTTGRRGFHHRPGEGGATPSRWWH